MYPQEDAVLFKSEQRGIFNTQKTIAAPQEFKRIPIHSRTSRPKSENSAYGALTDNDFEDEHEAGTSTFFFECVLAP